MIKQLKMDTQSQGTSAGWVVVVWALLWVLGTPTAHAVRVEGLYEAQTWVADQRPSERELRLREALAEVLTKVSGRRDAPALPALAAILQKPGTLLRSYRYLPLPADWPTEGLEPNGQLLVTAFDEQGVNRHLSQAGLPVWGALRSQVVVLLTVDEGSPHRLLVNDANPGPWGAAALVQAQRLGLAVTLPAAADEARGAEVWNDSPEVVKRLAMPYGAESTLLGRVTRTLPNGWVTRWSFYPANGAPLRWEGRTITIAQALASGLDRVFDLLAKQGAVATPAGDSSSFLLRIEGIDTLEAQARAARVLQSINGLQRADLMRVEAKVVTYRVLTRSSRERLMEDLRLSRGLILVTSPPGAGLELGDLVYRLIP